MVGGVGQLLLAWRGQSEQCRKVTGGFFFKVEEITQVGVDSDMGFLSIYGCMHTHTHIVLNYVEETGGKHPHVSQMGTQEH